MLSQEEMGRELAKLQRQLSSMRLQALVRTRNNAIAYEVGQVAQLVHATNYNHHTTSEALDELEALAARCAPIVAQNRGNG